MEYFGKDDLIKCGIEPKISEKLLAYCARSGFIKSKHFKAEDSFRQLTKYHSDDLKKSILSKLEEAKTNNTHLRYVGLWKEYLTILSELKK